MKTFLVITGIVLDLLTFVIVALLIRYGFVNEDLDKSALAVILMYQLRPIKGKRD